MAGRGTEHREVTVGAEDPAAFPPAVWEAVGGSRALLERFAALLAAEGEVRGLIGPRELPRLWSRHIVNSLAVAPFVPQGAQVADIGSGAGFPGVVLAIVRPDVTVVLVDAMERRTAWLRDAAEELCLGNVEVVTGRAEKLAGSRTFGVVTARAVAPLDRLAGWALPLVAPGGRLVALKGSRVRDEIDAARPVLRRLGAGRPDVVEVPSPLDGTITRVVVIER